MKWPRLSVVVPNYNHGAYLPRCLNALLKQTAPPFEVIVVDDASTDNSLEILERFAREHSNLRIIRNEKNQGAVKAALRGLSMVQGEYIFLPSADDEVVPGFFEASLRLLAEHPRAALSCTISTWHAPESGLKWHMAAGMASRACYLSADDLVRLGRQGRLCIPTCSAILKKEPMIECGGYLPELHWHADWFVTAIPAFRYGLCFVPEPLSNVDLLPASFSRKGMVGLEQRQVLSRILDRLNSPACADVAPRIRDSAALAMFGWPLLRLLIRQAQYRRFLTPHLVFWASYRSAEIIGKRILPRPLARLCLRLLYHHKDSPPPTA
jgi:glycosyltransferase involved in cell wall biosynthesis